MIIDLTKIIKDYNIALQGVIHVGGYNGEEIYEYKNLGIKDMVFFEPQKDLYNQILNKKAGGKNLDELNDERWQKLMNFLKETNRFHFSLLCIMENQFQMIIFFAKLSDGTNFYLFKQE
jgi:hypothetical protein